MIEEAKGITLYTKAIIFINWSLKLCGMVFLGGCVYTSIYGLPRILRHVELAYLQVELDGTQQIAEQAQDLATKTALIVEKRK